MSRETAIRTEDARPLAIDEPGPQGSPPPVSVIEPPNGYLSVDWAELWRYRDLLRFLVWRDVKVRYAQSVLGIGWAIIQPLFSMVVFTIVFGRLARIESDGAPYAIFSYTALVPWTYFSSSVADSTASLVNAAGMLSKVYFPRLVIPLTPLLAKLLDFAIALLVLAGMLLWYRVQPTIWALFVPALVILMIAAAFGIGMWLTALNVQYRDIRYAVGLLVQLWMYASPVVYPASLVPDHLRLLYGLNPMAGVIEGFRAAILGTVPMPWDLIGVGAITSLALLVSGAYYFRRVEDVFADVV